MRPGIPSTIQTPIQALLDGERSTCIPLDDRALHYGDGLFETVLSCHGVPCLWRRHLDRLAAGADRLGLPCPDSVLLRDELAQVSGGLDRGIVKIILTRGGGGRGYRPPAPSLPRRLLMAYALPVDSGRAADTGVLVRDCMTPASINPALAGIKHLNRLDQVLARAEWDDPDIAEGLMCDADGLLVGGTMSNLFVWDGRGLATPPVARAGIAGTVRDLTMELAAAAGIACAVRPIPRAELAHATGVFLTNARIGVWPVARLGAQGFDLTRLPEGLLRQIRQTAHTPED
jgi:4-amino-4-deoxychorismate lyase